MRQSQFLRFFITLRILHLVYELLRQVRDGVLGAVSLSHLITLILDTLGLQNDVQIFCSAIVHLAEQVGIHLNPIFCQLIYDVLGSDNLVNVFIIMMMHLTRNFNSCADFIVVFIILEIHVADHVELVKEVILRTSISGLPQILVRCLNDLINVVETIFGKVDFY